MHSKKLSEVDIKETMLDNEYVLGVDEDGEVVRTPKSTMGKVKTVNDIEPDENGNIKIDTGNPVLADVGDHVVNEEFLSIEFTGTSTIDPDYAGNPVVKMLCDLIAYEGTSVIVEFDGKKYECTSKYPPNDSRHPMHDSSYYMYRCLGNLRLVAPEDPYVEDTQEPFLFAIIGDDYYNTTQKWCIVAADDGNHTFRITKDVTKTTPIPEKYLPANALVRVIDYPGDFAHCSTLGGYTVDEMIAFIKNGGVVKIKDTLTVSRYQALSSVFYEAVGFVRTSSYEVSPVENGIIFATNAPSSMVADVESDGSVSEIISSNSTPLPILTWVNGIMFKGDYLYEEDEGNEEI